MMVVPAGFSARRVIPMVVVARQSRRIVPSGKGNAVVSRSLSSSSASSSPIMYPSSRLWTLPRRPLGRGKLVVPQQQPPKAAGRLRRGKATLANDTVTQSSSAGFVTTKGTAATAASVPTRNKTWLEALESALRKTRTIPIPRWITPRHYTITLSEVLGHSSFLLVAISYAVDDFLMLRCIAVAGSTSMLFFTYYQ